MAWYTNPYWKEASRKISGQNVKKNINFSNPMKSVLLHQDLQGKSVCNPNTLFKVTCESRVINYVDSSPTSNTLETTLAMFGRTKFAIAISLL